MGLFGKKWNGEIMSPVEGMTYDLSKVKDPVFSQKMMGEGIAIKPTSNKIYAPISGILSTVFPTNHAYGITNKDGLSLLIHIGLDTVKLNGKGFTCYVKQNQKVKQGDLLAEMDIPYIVKNAVSEDILIVITPESSVKLSKAENNKKVTINDTIIYTQV